MGAINFCCPTSLDDIEKQVDSQNQKPMPKSTRKVNKERLGIKNNGNTCYVNGGVQCLIRSKPVIQFLKDNRSKIKEQKIKYPLSYQLLRVIDKLFQKQANTVDVSQLKLIIEKNNSTFRDFNQHDSIQFFLTLLGALTNQWKNLQVIDPEQKIQDKKQPVRSIIKDLFGLRYETSYQCNECHFPFILKQNTKVHMIPLAKNTTQNKKIKIQDCLKQFQREELLKQQNKLFCREKCQRQTEQTKKMIVQEAGDILFLGIHKDNSTSSQRQLQIPLILDPKLFIKNYKKYNGKTYVLNSAILHTGTNKFGHYRALCRRIESKGWLLCNDTIVSQISEQDMTRELSKAYGLFYELVSVDKIDPQNSSVRLAK